MPELPEVEHVVRALRRSILGSRITHVDLRLPRIAEGQSVASFTQALRGAVIGSVDRRGKHILIKLDNGRALLVHLRMTGKFICVAQNERLPPYAHVLFYLDSDRCLVFCDMRQFGKMKVVAISRLQQSKQLRNLAPEPLSDDFSVLYLQNTVSRSRRTLKQLLLDQTRVLGLGNIYASEALFLARISPFTRAVSLSPKRVARLHWAIQETLKEAIAAGSTLRIDLTDGNESYFGSSERFWRVYEREGEPCVNCASRIRRIVHAGRSTYFCPRCQRS